MTENIGSVAEQVAENAAAAAQMRITTQDVTDVMQPVAETAEQQSGSAQDAAIATSDLASGVGEIDATARALRDQSVMLDGLVKRFIIDDALVPVPGPNMPQPMPEVRVRAGGDLATV